MIHLFNRKELMLTWDMSELSKIRDILASNNVEYIVRTRNMRTNTVKPIALLALQTANPSGTNSDPTESATAPTGTTTSNLFNGFDYMKYNPEFVHYLLSFFSGAVCFFNSKFTLDCIRKNSLKLILSSVHC